jgi:HPt (histidine-containing phosphotransfer) domain-containing protein
VSSNTTAGCDPGARPEGQAVEERLRDLARETDGEFVREIVNEFLDTAPERLEQVEYALRQVDFTTAGRDAHSLKGNCATFGLLRLAQALQQLETNCKAADEKEAMARLQHIQENYADASRVLATVARQIY